MTDRDDDREIPLPGTLRFVLVMGACFIIGWFILYFMMLGRW